MEARAGYFVKSKTKDEADFFKYASFRNSCRKCLCSETSCRSRRRHFDLLRSLDLLCLEDAKE